MPGLTKKYRDVCGLVVLIALSFSISGTIALKAGLWDSESRDVPSEPNAPSETTTQSGPVAKVTAPVVPELPSDVTSPEEAKRVDSVQLHDVKWAPCENEDAEAETQRLLESIEDFPALKELINPYYLESPGIERWELECGAIRVPLDYAEVRGDQLVVRLYRRLADNPEERIGTLFTNAGGPGIPGFHIPAFAELYFPEEVRAKFDMIGINPRGTGGLAEANCFSDIGKGFSTWDEKPDMPLRGSVERARFDDIVDSIAQACSRPANTIASHASTANMARDMEIVRRSIDEGRLNFYGLGHGSVLGQTYADMFPDRVRAVALDGVINSDDWYGFKGNGDQNLGLRVQSVQATDKILTELLTRCDEAREGKCSLGEIDGSSMDIYLRTKEYLKENPITITRTDTDETVVDDRVFASLVAYFLQDPDYIAFVPDLIYDFHSLIGKGVDEKQEYATELIDIVVANTYYTQRGGSGVDAPLSFMSSLENLSKLSPEEEKLRKTEARHLVVCADIATPEYESAVAQAQNHPWTLAGGVSAGQYIECSHPEWTTEDRGRFMGPTGARTAAPVLIVGARWDPVASYEQAEKVAAKTPHHFFLTSESWGHSAASGSPCVRKQVSAYLLRGEQPTVSVCSARKPFW